VEFRLAVLIKEFQKYPGDTGSTPVQSQMLFDFLLCFIGHCHFSVAILTEKINHITVNLNFH
jgi:ribosomal protein S15P/S13E